MHDYSDYFYYHCKQQRGTDDEYTLYAFYYLEHWMHTLRVELENVSVSEGGNALRRFRVEVENVKASEGGKTRLGDSGSNLKT